jgi:uncharacterized protein
MQIPPEVERFLQCRRIAFVGVSSRPDDFSRKVYRKFKESGYEVVPVRPDRADVEGTRAFARVQDIPGKVDGAFLMTPITATDAVVLDCASAGIRHVWMHRGTGHGSVSDAGIQFCEHNGIDVVAGECPMMFLPNTALLHRVHGTVRSLFR